MQNMEKVIKKYLREDIGLNEYRTNQEYKGIVRHQDICKAFYEYIVNGWTKSSLIKVKGYDAKTLKDNYPLSVLGAYNYLIFLREKPKEAQEKLEEGLPRR